MDDWNESYLPTLTRFMYDPISCRNINGIIRLSSFRTRRWLAIFSNFCRVFWSIIGVSFIVISIVDIDESFIDAIVSLIVDDTQLLLIKFVICTFAHTVVLFILFCRKWRQKGGIIKRKNRWQNEHTTQPWYNRYVFQTAYKIFCLFQCFLFCDTPAHINTTVYQNVRCIVFVENPEKILLVKVKIFFQIKKIDWIRRTTEGFTVSFYMVSDLYDW